MLAFHSKKSIKDKYVRRVRAHRAADDIVQGLGFEDGKGCAVGCTLNNYSHAQYPIELGIPLHLAHLEDRIHEGLPLKDAKEWPLRFLSAPRVGADLSDVWPQFAIWLLTDAEHGVIRFAKREQQAKAAIEGVAQLYRERVPAGDERWRKAHDAAYAVAADATYAAAYAAAAVADATAYTAYAADGVGGGRNARIIHWRACADKLEGLLRAAPVTAKGAA